MRVPAGLVEKAFSTVPKGITCMFGTGTRQLDWKDTAAPWHGSDSCSFGTTAQANVETRRCAMSSKRRPCVMPCLT